MKGGKDLLGAFAEGCGGGAPLYEELCWKPLIGATDQQYTQH